MNGNSFEQLASTIRGSVITPEAEGYEDARRVWNGTVDKRPAVVVRCAGVADVVEAVNLARREGLPVSVRGGGHHVAGSSVAEDGLVIDMSAMRAVRVDPASRTVRAQGGALIGDVDHEAQAFGLAVPLGLMSETGIAGLTLAGGMSWLRRKHGLACDNLISVDVVTADGRLLTASATENADLFWALRGGGWDMGVVTSFEYRAYPLDREVFLTFVAYPHAESRRVLEGFDRFMASAPPEAAPILVFWTFPDGEPYPEEVRGKDFIAVAGPYAGPVSEGERVMQPLRELATPMLDMSEPTPYVALQRMFDEDYPNGGRYYWKSTYLKPLDAGAMEALIEIGSNRPTPITSLDVWPLGGAFARVGASESPVGHRGASYLIGVEANWTDPALDERAKAWARGAVERLAPYSTGGSYLNFEDLSEARAVEASHGPSFARLVAIKKQYDPMNVFRSRRGLVD